MPVVATDDFNRADSPTLGANWTFPYSGSPTMYRVISNQCKCPTGGGIRGIFWNADSFSNDQYSKIKTIAFSNPFHTGFGVAVRCSGTSGGDDFNGYTFYNDGNDWKLQRQDAGVATDLATGTQSISVNDILEIRATGTTIAAYINGSAVSGASASDSTYASGNAGMVVRQDGVVDAICDDWEGGNVTADVTVDLTGVAASPAIGNGTVQVTGIVVSHATESFRPRRREKPKEIESPKPPELVVATTLRGVLAMRSIGRGTFNAEHLIESPDYALSVIDARALLDVSFRMNSGPVVVVAIGRGTTNIDVDLLPEEIIGLMEA